MLESEGAAGTDGGTREKVLSSLVEERWTAQFSPPGEPAPHGCLPSSAFICILLAIKSATAANDWMEAL